jgi:hypothetical protein
MTRQVQDPLAMLVGKALWGCGRAADMATFQFGLRVKRKDSLNRPSEVGEYALHIQCAWHIRRGERVLVGSRDLYFPDALTDLNQGIPPDFDWDRHPNRRERQLRSLFEDGRREFAVNSVELRPDGRLRIDLDQQLSLEAFPDNSLPNEHWRLFSPTTNGDHVIMTGIGITVG